MQLLLNSGADPHAVNNRGRAPLDVVSIECDGELEGPYRHEYDAPELTFDGQFVRETILQIAEMMRDWKAENFKTDSK